MRLLILPLVLMFFGVTDAAHAAWVKTEIDTLDRRIMCAVEGEINSKKTIVLCGENGPLFIYQWNENKWEKETVVSGSSYPTVAFFADFRGDGFKRLYITSWVGSGISELTKGPAGRWLRRDLKSPWNTGIWSATSGKSRIDKRTHLIASVISGMSDRVTFVQKKRMLEKISTAKSGKFDGPCPSSIYNFDLLDCVLDGRGWKCDHVAPTCWWPKLFNPPAIADWTDIIIGDQIYVRKAKKWSDYAGIETRRHLLSSRRNNNKFFTDMGEFLIDDGLEVSKRRDLGTDFEIFQETIAPGFHRVSGAYGALGSGMVLGGEMEWVIGVEDPTVYRIWADGKGRTPIAETWGITDFMLVGDYRGDEKERVYLMQNGLGKTSEVSKLIELSYFKDESSALVANVEFDLSGEAMEWTQGTGVILGEILKSELASYPHIKVIEARQILKIVSEKKFQNKNCSTPDCAHEIGKLANARAIIRMKLSQIAGSINLSVIAVEASTGETIFSFESSAPSSEDIAGRIRGAAEKCAMLWPG